MLLNNSLSFKETNSFSFEKLVMKPLWDTGYCGCIFESYIFNRLLCFNDRVQNHMQVLYFSILYEVIFVTEIRFTGQTFLIEIFKNLKTKSRILQVMLMTRHFMFNQVSVCLYQIGSSLEDSYHENMASFQISLIMTFDHQIKLINTILTLTIMTVYGDHLKEKLLRIFPDHLAIATVTLVLKMFTSSSKTAIATCSN